MGRERFYAEDFGGVMSSKQEIHTKLVRRDCSPMWRFPRDKCVDLFLGDSVDFRPCTTCDDTNRSRPFWAKVECFNRAIQRSPQFSHELFLRQQRACFQSNESSFFLEEWLRRFEPKRRGKLSVVANHWMDVERKVRAVKCDIIFEGKFQLPSQ